MEENPIATRAGLTVAVAALAGVVLALFAVLDIGPCAEDELSVEEFIAQGDEVCRLAHEEFQELQRGVPRTPSEAADLMGALIEVAEEERDTIADLSAPASLADRIDRYLEARERGIDLLREGRDAAEDADAPAYEELQTEVASTQVDPRYEIAREIGFEECSKPLRPA